MVILSLLGITIVIALVARRLSHPTLDELIKYYPDDAVGSDLDALAELVGITRNEASLAVVEPVTPEPAVRVSDTTPYASSSYGSGDSYD